MRMLDLFSGIGGFSLAASWAGIKTVQFVENDKYCQRVLAKNFKGVPIHDDIKTFKGQPGTADIVSGGFPCQPFSVAGQRRGTEDDRALWPEMFRIIQEVQPAWVLGENVAGIVSLELDNVLSDLEDEGYETQAFIIPACAVGAPHRRDRVWIVANSTGIGGNWWMAGPRKEAGRWAHTQVERRSRWPAEPAVGRVAHGVSGRVDRLKGLGNAPVPQVAYEILRTIKYLNDGEV